MIGIRSAISIRARGHRPHLEAVYMTAPRSVCRNTKKPLPSGGRPYMTKGGLLRFARNDEKNFMTPRSRGARRPSCARTVRPRKQRAQGMPGAQRTRSIACEIKKHTSIVTTVTPESPGIPRAMVLRLTFVLSSVTMLFCHRRPADMVLSKARLGRLASAKLDASLGASEPHDFAVRFSIFRPAR